MNIFMIYPCQGNMSSFNYGLASVIAVLKRAGNAVKLVLVDDYVTEKDIIRKILDFRTDIVGFSCMSNYWQYVKNLSRKIRSTPLLKNTPIFVGGPHTIVCPSSIEESEDIDGFCLGEGEYSFTEVADKISKGIDFSDTPNFYFNKKDKGTIRNELEMLIENLDDLPFPARDVFPDKVFTNYANFTFSRGCPYSCSYCCNSAFHKIFNGKGKQIRHRGVSKALEEIQLFVEKYKPDILSFDDDCFNKNPEWFRKFCSEYKTKIGLPYTCNTRPELLDRESAKLLKESGCKKINIGIESGDENLRKTVLNRNIKDTDIIRAFGYAKEYGMETMSFNMIGFPGETKDSIKKTIELNKKIRPSYAQVSVFYPYAGTPLGKLCKDRGYIENEACLFTYMGNGSSILKMPNLLKRDIKDLFFRFDLEIYNSNNFITAYITKKLKLMPISIYKVLPRFLKKVLRSIKSCAYKSR